jgi:hypothetical protein
MQATDPLVPARADLFNQMRAISDPNSQLDALTYDLTETKLDTFAEYQKQRQNTAISFGPIGGVSGSISADADFFEGSLIQSRSGQSHAVQILPKNPDN